VPALLGAAGWFVLQPVRARFSGSVLVAFLGEDCLSDVASSAAAANTELRATGSNTNHPGAPGL